MEIFRLEDKITTEYSGHHQLSRFYHFGMGLPQGSEIQLDFTEAEWFDGNLCALLWAVAYVLKKNFGHLISTDEIEIKNRFDILFRNGFLRTGEVILDNRKSAVPIQDFDCSDKEGFCKYVNDELLSHRGMPALGKDLKDKIMEDLLEVFCNSQHHAGTSDPIFVGGQYYPKQRVLKFTMVDVGDGFLPRVNKATNGKIGSNLDAILWALQGNSTKLFFDKCPGGLGIKNMYKYCKENGGVLQIISNDGFWSSDLEGTIFEGGRVLKAPFIGITINLIFRKDL